MPFSSYVWWEAVVYQKQEAQLVSPAPDQKKAIRVSVNSKDRFPAFVSSNSRSSYVIYRDFTISIPSIKLENAKVVVDTNDFEKNLAQLPGTAMPGEKGNLFITGHSSLPQFYRQDNYKAIFTKLPDIKKGDLVTVDAGGQTFTYKVLGLKVVDPSETWVINPPDDEGRYLTLMTCVPPGLYLKRLIVLAVLQ